MLHGLPASGKSTLGMQIVEARPGWVLLKSGAFRKEESKSWAFDESDDLVRRQKDESYRAMLAAARSLLLEGKSVILDATFHKRYRREWAYALAQECGVSLAVITVGCADDVVSERLMARKGVLGTDAALKSMDEYLLMKRQAEQLVERSRVFVFNSGVDDVGLLLEKI